MKEVIEFLQEYTEFFESVEGKQKDKLAVLTRGELAGIEETIVMQQALSKQIQNMEDRRMQVFEKAGYGGKTFREMVETAEGEEQKELAGLYERLNASIGNIRFLNQKCIGLAQSALYGTGMDVETRQTDSMEKYHPARSYSGSILQTKA